MIQILNSKMILILLEYLRTWDWIQSFTIIHIFRVGYSLQILCTSQVQSKKNQLYYQKTKLILLTLTRQYHQNLWIIIWSLYRLKISKSQTKNSKALMDGRLNRMIQSLVNSDFKKFKWINHWKIKERTIRNLN